jgi:sterol desaturase/sphingolipid hydroxylase (fatty acid hydroxylase superfamily)
MEAGAGGSAAYLYAGAYLGAITVAAIWEAAAPLRASSAPLRPRWIGNFALAAIDTVAIRALLPLSTFAFAIIVEDRGWGVLNVIALPFWAAFAVSTLGLDLGRYVLHRLHHHVPLLWRVHAVHHSDLDYDFTTAFRFHPIEALIGVVWTFALIAVLGPPVEAVIAVEILAAAVSIAQHANARMPPTIDRALRLVLITPDMHRVHHSARREETDSNFGTVFPFWDRLFGTYRDAPALGHEGMCIGLDEYRDESCLAVRAMLLQPFRTAPQEAAEATPRSGT